MFPGLLLLVATAMATCPGPTFAFQGQPECVGLVFEDGRINVTNACQYPLLVDQSLQLHGGDGSSSVPIPPRASAEVRDLSFFTLGLNGTLYRVVAVLAPTPASCHATPRVERERLLAAAE